MQNKLHRVIDADNSAYAWGNIPRMKMAHPKLLAAVEYDCWFAFFKGMRKYMLSCRLRKCERSEHFLKELQAGYVPVLPNTHFLS